MFIILNQILIQILSLNLIRVRHVKNIGNKCDQRSNKTLTSLLSTSDQMMSTTGLNGCPPLIGQNTQTTQTLLTSAALPALPKVLGAQPQQSPQSLTSLVISPVSLTIKTTTAATKTSLTPTANNGRKESHQNSKNKHIVVNRTNGLFEGSHIHFSPIDNKPLCSYSTKLCKQRRINGYAFCIRHILEDPSAPFRQCKHVAKYNQQKCSNAIPANEDRLFCNSHMQIAGMAPKKERKDKKGSGGQSSVATNTSNQLNMNSNGICHTINNNIKCVSSLEKGFNVNTVNENHTNFDAFIKPTIKLNGITNKVNANTIQKLNDNLQKKCSDKSTATTGALPLNETSFSSHTNNFKLNNIHSNQTKTQTNTNLNKNKTTDNQKNTNESKPKPKRKKKEKKVLEKYVLARKKKTGDNLFNYHIWSETDDETEGEDNRNDRLMNNYFNSETTDETFPLIFGTLSTNIADLEPNELKNELLSQKWLLKNLIDVRKKDFAPQLDSTRAILKTLNRNPMKRKSYLDYKLTQNSKRCEKSIRKGICCYSTDESRCRRPSLPFTRHCIEHILYNVDQLLFARCTAKCAKTMTQCSRPTFDIINEDPLCSYHQMVGSEVDERSGSPTTDAKNKKRRKSKPMALTRVSRRGKKRRKGPNGADIPVIVEDSIDSRLSIGSIDDDSLHSHSDTNDITINLLTQKPDHNQSTDIVKHTITAAIPQTTTSAAIVSSVAAPDLPLLRLPPLLPPVVTNIDPPVVSMVPSVVLDHSMPPPPPLEPTEEALVASIVADLPQLTTDADFTEVLNKIPDDFSDFLLEHPNGDIPSTEETEALEQALAMVNKDVQNLVAVAGMNGNSTGGAQMSDFGGQSDIIGFTNWLGSLTSEQRQQLNGLIDGAIASNSLSPILKNACDAYPSQTLLPSSAPPIMKSSTNYVTGVHSQNNAFPALYPTLGPSPQQEFVPISAPVPTLLNNNLLMNGLSSHPS